MIKDDSFLNEGGGWNYKINSLSVRNMIILRNKSFANSEGEKKSTSEKIDSTSKKVAKVAGITAGVGLGATLAGGGIAAHGLKAAAESGGAAGAKRILGGTTMAGLGGQAAKWGTRGAALAGAVWAGNRLINGKPKNNK